MRTTRQKHSYHLHGIRVVLIGVSLIALCVARVDATSVTQEAPKTEVLAYATNVNRSDLLAQTNAARAQNGLAPLTLNAQLNSSAQNKGQHMINNNYWAHVAPDGTQPWYFFEQAGYAYTRAGENLAYGFDSSSATVTAWMNSPSHRDNILGDYQDVGFGIASGDNYQGGPNTVVVAHYGKPVAPAPAPAPAPAVTQPTPSSPVSPATAPQSSTPASTQAASETVPTTPQDTPQTSETPTEAGQPTAAPITQSGSASKQVQTSNNRSVNLFQAVMSGSAPAYGFVSLGLMLASLGGFALTHRALFRHTLATSEAYVMKHPAIDFAAVGAITLLILTTTVSRI